MYLLVPFPERKDTREGEAGLGQGWIMESVWGMFEVAVCIQVNIGVSKRQFDTGL